MSKTIKDLRALITPVEKGAAGYCELAKSEKVTAYEILNIIHRLEEIERNE